VEVIEAKKEEEAKVIVEETKSEVIEVETKEVEHKDVEVEVEVEKVTETITTVTKVDEVAVVQPAVTQKTSWFRRLASGAGAAAAGALTQVDGAWKRAVDVVTVKRAEVDSRAPVSKTSYVYYDDEEVFDAQLTEKSTGVTYKTQLIYDEKVNKYYIYILYGEEVKLEGPFETVEKAKESFQVIYKEKTGIAWQERETTVSEQWSYEVKTYETIETTETIEEIVDNKEAEVIVSTQKETVVGDVVTKETIETTVEREQVVSEVDTKVVEVGGQTVETEVTVVKTEAEVEVVEHKVIDTVKEVEVKEDVKEVTETTATVIETGVIAKPAVTEKTSWFRRLASGAADAAGAVAKGAS
ncbi:hypothetical protein BGW41_007972, partial [Actinomortierella wolfii]